MSSKNAIRDRVQSLIDSYAPRLAEHGIRLTVAKHYFETEVEERSSWTGSGSHLFMNIFSLLYDRHREKKKGYHYAENRYHCLILSVLPLDENVLPQKECRDYACIYHEVKRAHIGDDPYARTAREDRILAKFDRKIRKILKKAEKSTVEKTCRDTVWDALRYTLSSRYGYKREVLGRCMDTWEILFNILAALLVMATVMVMWLLTR